MIDARTQIPVAATVVPIQAHETLSLRALVTQARTNLAGHTRLHKVVFDKGFWDGTDLWWRAQRGITCVGPAKAHMAGTAAARAQAAAGEGVTVGGRVHTGRHGPGKTAWVERRETAVVGIQDLTTDDQDGTPAHGRHHHRRDCEAHPLHAGVVRQWQGRDDGPSGNTVFLTNAAVDKPVPPFDDDDRSLIEHCWIKAATQQWDLAHPPQHTGRAVRGPVRCTCLLCALAPAERLRCEPAQGRGEPVGWQRWRRQLLEQTRATVIVVAQRWDALLSIAECALLVGVTRQDVPPGLGTPQEVLATYGLTTHR